MQDMSIKNSSLKDQSNTSSSSSSSSSSSLSSSPSSSSSKKKTNLSDEEIWNDAQMNLKGSHQVPHPDRPPHYSDGPHSNWLPENLSGSTPTQKLNSLINNFAQGLQALAPHLQSNPNHHLNGLSHSSSSSSSLSFSNQSRSNPNRNRQNNAQNGSQIEVRSPSNNILQYPSSSLDPDSLPWPEVSDIEREEIVRLVLQSLREIGYPAAAMTLEAESGISPDPSPEITRFRENILAGRWSEVEELLEREYNQELGRHRLSGKVNSNQTSQSLFGVDEQVLNAVRFLVAQEKYLELLELRRIRKALVVLRVEVTPLVNFPEVYPIGPLPKKSRTPVSTIGNSLNKLSVAPGSGKTEHLILSSILGSRGGAGGGGGGPAEDELDGGDEKAITAEEQQEDARVQKLCLLSSLMMCGTAEEVRERADWPGVLGGSRVKLLEELQELIPPQRLLPHQRLPRLLEQSKDLQRLQCLYHVNNPHISLLSNHSCSRSSFPTETSHILAQHSDEVWRIEWSHDGTRLASGSQDRSCIVWRLKSSKKSSLNGAGFAKDENGRSASSFGSSRALSPSHRLPSFNNLGDEDFELEPEFVLKEHPLGVCCLAWSPDDSVLLTGADCTITMWNTKTGCCIATMVKHYYEVSALSWLPDGKGFVSGAMDSDVLFWDLKGQNTYTWHASPTRVVDLAVSPDGKTLVAIGYGPLPSGSNGAATSTITEGNGNGTSSNQEGSPGSSTANGEGSDKQRRLHIFNIPQKEEVAVFPLNRELTCISISDDSKYALVNQSPNEVLLYSLENYKLVRRFAGQKQGRFVIRSCFGGLDRNFVLSGSEDGKIYVWHLESGNLIEVLKGHSDDSSVNAVAWNPVHPAMFASASDDKTVRIWQTPNPKRKLKKVTGESKNENNGEENRLLVLDKNVETKVAEEEEDEDDEDEDEDEDMNESVYESNFDRDLAERRRRGEDDYPREPEREPEDEEDGGMNE